MNNKCPQCGKKLSVFYFRPECSGCGCNFMSYNYKERLEADAEKAAAEYEKLERIIAKITPKKLKAFIDKKKDN